MRQIIFSFFYLIIFTSINSTLFSQDCFEYYKSCSAYDSKYYKYDDNSSSKLLTSTTPVNVVFGAVAGINYKITICSDSINVPLSFVIKDIDNTILFDNSSENYIRVFEFSVKEIKKLTIEVSITKKCETLNSGCSGCLAVIIEKSIKPRTGF